MNRASLFIVFALQAANFVAVAAMPSPGNLVAAERNASAPRGPIQVAADDVAEGHSYHGEAFDQGPRQAAYLMPGMGTVSFPISTRSVEAQKFFDQGVAQLHGFWYFEAERSFRQASLHDPDAVMPYWGMMMANINNSKRAEKFIAEAVKNVDKAPPREQMWVNAYSAYYKAEPKKDKERREALIRALEDIVHEFPDDVEAKAFLVLHIWLSRSTSPISSRQAVDALIDQVLELEPMHPIHHYRIHLWDDTKAVQALGSAALGGQSTPGIAHMWHMPGHTFSKLQRYGDAAWQQEAASRVDHAYMMRDYVLPDQIHNYAHNHEWLIRDLSHIGRARYGVELAKNFIEIPRHPKYNLPATKGSSQYGRARLTELLQRFEMWPDVVALAATPYLDPTDVPREQVKRLRLLGAAHDELGNTAEAEKCLAELETMLKSERDAQRKAGEKAAEEAKKKPPIAAAAANTKKPATTTTATSTKPADPVATAKLNAENPFRAQIALLDAAVAELKARAALRAKKYDDAIKLFRTAGITSGEYLSRVQLAAGNKSEAERMARDAAKKNAQQVIPLANLVYVLWKNDKHGEAKKLFGDLRTLAAVADIDLPPLARLQPLADELGWPTDWRTPAATPDDVGVRPPLDALGPIRWSPPPAKDFQLTTVDGREVSLAQYRGQNVVLIFYLGVGCLHCTEQLKAFAPLYKDFQAAGVEVLAVSTDTDEALRSATEALEASERYPFAIASNADLNLFKAYRAFDDFEQQPLHATVFVDAAGRVRWIDTGADPFMDAKFLLGESKRLVSLTRPSPEVTVVP